MFAGFEVLLVTLSTLAEAAFSSAMHVASAALGGDMHPQLLPHQRVYSNGPKQVSQGLAPLPAAESEKPHSSNNNIVITPGTEIFASH